VVRFSSDLKSFAADHATGGTRKVGYLLGALTPEEVAGLAGQFPGVIFEPLGSSWPDRLGAEIHVLIVGADAASPSDAGRIFMALKSKPQHVNVLVALRHADLASSRAFTRAGAADVLSVPAGEAALALAIERLLAREPVEREPARKSGQIVAVLKAGGGVGATALGVQTAHLLASRATGAGLCFADLDLQFGSAALYFDLGHALTVADCVAVGDVLGETQFATALSAHKSGVRVLAAPHDVTPLDTLTPSLVEGLIAGFRRDFALTILDLPSAWTAWTNRALQLSDRIVLVTRLSVPHVHLVRRQLKILNMQNLAHLPLTLVCNAITGEEQDLLSVKAAERAIGREFDVMLPSDARAMGTATNQGLALADARRGTKLEKQIGLLAERMAADAFATRAMR